MVSVSGAFRLGAKTCNRMARIFDSTRAAEAPAAEPVNPPGGPWDRWFKDQGDKTVRLNYDLGPDSIVIDLGGYEGQWASDIFAKYLCSVYVFEPVPHFAQKIRERFSQNKKVKVFQYGLAAKSETSLIWISDDASSALRTVSNAKPTPMELRAFDEFLSENHIDSIDLLKINIEGGEYDLLEHLIHSGTVKKIKNIQVQFHDFVENAAARMEAIQKGLAITHEPTFSYRFVWENWRRKD